MWISVDADARREGSSCAFGGLCRSLAMNHGDYKADVPMGAHDRTSLCFGASWWRDRLRNGFLAKRRADCLTAVINRWCRGRDGVDARRRLDRDFVVLRGEGRPLPLILSSFLFASHTCIWGRWSCGTGFGASAARLVRRVHSQHHAGGDRRGEPNRCVP